MDAAIETILAAARTAPGAGYNERLKLLAMAAQCARSLCRELTREQAQHARPVLRVVLELPLVGKCAAQCCEASSVRAAALAAKCAVLQTWARLDADAVDELAPALLAQLAAPSSRRIALAAVELVGRSEAGRSVFAAQLADALMHPRWQVAESAARGLGKLSAGAPEAARRALAQALRHKQWQVRRAAAKALGALTGGAHADLARAAHRDRHLAVRYAACKATGEALPRR